MGGMGQERLFNPTNPQSPKSLKNLEFAGLSQMYERVGFVDVTFIDELVLSQR